MAEYLWEGVPAGEPCFHIHHGRLLEWSIEPLEVRAEFIRQNKPKDEQPVRLERMRPVPRDKLPEDVVRAGDAYFKASRALDEARRALDEARRALDEAWRAYDEAWRAFDEAWLAYDKARRAYGEAWRAYDEARRAFDEAIDKHRTEIEKLHAEECPDCPWNGHTLFPEKED